MKNVGSVIRSIKMSNVNDDLSKSIVDSLIDVSKDESFCFSDGDVVGVSEEIVSKYEENFVSINDIIFDIKKKFKCDHIGIVYPTFSINGFDVLFKAIARSFKKITMVLSYPCDEIGNEIVSWEKLIMNDVNVSKDIIGFDEYVLKYNDFNVVDYYKNVCDDEGCEFNVLFSNRPEVILDYTKNIIVSSINERNYIKERLIAHGALSVLKLSDIMNEPVNGSGYNLEYGLIGSKGYNDVIWLFPRNGKKTINDIQKLLFEKTFKNIEVMIYVDSSFKERFIYSNGLNDDDINLINELCYLISKGDNGNIVLMQNFKDRGINESK